MSLLKPFLKETKTNFVVPEVGGPVQIVQSSDRTEGPVRPK